MSKSIRSRLRLVFAILSALITLSLLSIAIYKALTIGQIGITGAIASNDETRKANDIRIDQVQTIFHFVLAILGVLTGLIIAKREEVRVRLADRPEVVMLACSVFLLAGSFAFYFFYMNKAVETLHELGTIYLANKITADLFGGDFSFLFTFQILLFVGALGITALLLISINQLKE